MTEPLDWARVAPDTVQRNQRTRRFLIRWLTIQERQGRIVRKRKDGDHTLFEAFAGSDLKTLSLDSLEMPSLSTQMDRLRGGSDARPWRPATIREALGVPAILRANSLIANTTGSLAMRALRNGAEMAPEDRPRVIVRPDPNRTPRDFYRDTAWNLGHSGEAWWYVTHRDSDGNADALYNVPDPAEVHVEATTDPIRPLIEWRGKSTADGTLARDDMRLLTWLPSWDGLRGQGPLQFCGAAWSVSVQSQYFAANFYATGGWPNIWIKAAMPISGDDDDWSTTDQVDAGAATEAERLKLAWISTAPNTPKVSFGDEIEDIKQFEPSVAGTQMLEARNWQNGEAARAYGIPGSLLEYQQAGSSLTYQNLEGEFTKFIRGCLRIGYLETIEQAMSDLLTRSTVSLFNTEQLEAPDVKTRFEVYQLALEVLGPVEGAEYARKREGLAPGNIENAPVPFAAPVVSVPRIAASTAMRDVRCPRCQRLIVRAAGTVEGFCRHCKATVAA